ncbi:hypothetical protein FNV43_RR19910 [Rhamnella rubrinervis]|uniref:Bowman-Birk serine protease inhibitors family domain-containing protein n=1 Tax=Rhamnella rubrinervis TaxID=2594499 RepID=A0A8K0GPY7_9ROSA|nr:hypothetical protein FNV43_RR19910 [Rhamnella rubrinervis]
MALKKVAVLSMAVLFLLVAVSTSVSAARADHVLDIFELLSAKNQEFSKSVVRVVRGKNVRGDNAEACCDTCICTRSIPPQCTCTDTFQSTDLCEGCDKCLCTFSMPPICRCLDMSDSCKPPCSSSATTITTNEAAN